MIERLATEAVSGTVLVVDACADTERLLGDADIAGVGLTLESVTDAEAAIARIEAGDAVDVVLLAPGLPDPVRVAQRVHSLDRQGAVMILAPADRHEEIRHALELAPFLEGDVVLVATSDAGAVAEEVAAAAARTQTRRAERAERKRRRETPPPLSARYLGTLLDSAPIGIVTLDADGAVIGWNRRAGEMLEVPEVEALGTPFEQLFAAGDRDRLRALIAHLTASGIGAVSEVFDLGERSFELTGARFAIRSGETGTLLILQDITARVAAERELRLQAALLEAQADSAVAGIAVVTQSGRTERVNRRFAEIWGIDQAAIHADAEAAVRHALPLVEDPEALRAGIEALIRNPEADFADEVRLKDGRVLERYGAHIRADDGEPIGRVWFYTDITARKREEESLRFLADATDLLSSSLDYETTLQRVAELAVPRIADECTVDVGEPEDDRVASVMRWGRSHVAGSEMIVPIQVRGRVFGAITFVSSDPMRRYGDDDLALAEELARRAAIAIDNSRVHAELRNTARTLQESLLPPQLPEIEGLELAARFRTAGIGMQVGGDFYDVFETGEQRWGVAIGDVCGKGAEAAALTALSRYTVRAAAMYEETTDGVLSVLNHALLRQRGDFRFTTLAFCIVDLASERCTLRVACGGHPRPLVLRCDGRVEPAGATGPLLGVFDDASFEEETLPLEDGDAIVLFTDGLTDAHAPERLLDETELVRVLGSCSGLSAGEIASRLERAALGGSGAPPRDDIAIVVLKVGS